MRHRYRGQESNISIRVRVHTFLQIQNAETASSEAAAGTGEQWAKTHLVGMVYSFLLRAFTSICTPEYISDTFLSRRRRLETRRHKATLIQIQMQ